MKVLNLSHIAVWSGWYPWWHRYHSGISLPCLVLPEPFHSLIKRWNGSLSPEIWLPWWVDGVEVTLGSCRSFVIIDSTAMPDSVSLGVLTLQTLAPIVWRSPGHRRGLIGRVIKQISDDPPPRPSSCPNWHWVEQKEAIIAEFCLNL